MATKAQVEKAILDREGFRVELEAFAQKRQALPAYDYPVMAPQRWKVSDWKNVRLAEYRLLMKGATVYRGDGTPLARDLQLGNLRDTYYAAEYGSLQPLGGSIGDEAGGKVTLLRPHRKRSNYNGKATSRKRR
jgi:hypothetical protein